MNKKKIISVAMAMTLSIGTFSSGVAATTLPNVKGQTESDKHVSLHTGPFDMSIANDEKLIEMLKEEGKIKKNATIDEAQEQLHEYLEDRQEEAQERSEGELAEEQVEKHKKMKNKHDHEGLEEDDDDDEKDDDDRLDPVVEEDFTGDVRKDNVLAILIDFPNYQNSSIQPEETDMYYEDYPAEHFNKMIFGSNGYTGPNGKNLVSVKQFYEKQSGGSYTIGGDIAGWYTADHPAAYYGANDPAPDGSDIRPRVLVKEALAKAANDPNVDLSNFDQEDRYDLDGDGNLREPDGIIDHLMVIHAGVGEEAGGGSLGSDAIWSHRWNLGGLYQIPGSDYAAYDYTIEPEDGAAGVFAHEYGHDLGLPDEYDTQYSGAGEAVAYWSIMASGSWAGKVPGTEPTGFSPYAREFLQASMEGSNWLKGETVSLDSISEDGKEFILDQANTKGTHNDAIHVSLPDKKNMVNTPFSGKYEYFSGKGDNLDNSMVRTVDLSNAQDAKLTFKTWYDIELGWDYASIKVKEAGSDKWTTIPGNITTTENPNGQNPGNGITGNSNGWVDATFDLSQYAGKQIQLKFNYWTDVAATMPGFYVDNIAVVADGQQLLFDDAEGDTPAFELKGFTKDDGTYYTEHYYLLEWRNHAGVDKGLAHIRRGDSLMSYGEGLVVWYVDKSYDNNWTGIHPGEGFLGVVDADQKVLKWSDGSLADTRYQIHDAAFNVGKSEKMFLDYRDLLGVTLKDNHTRNIDEFEDSNDYSNDPILDAGRNVPEFGLEFEVVETSRDQSTARIEISQEDAEDDHEEDNEDSEEDDENDEDNEEDDDEDEEDEEEDED